MGGHHPRGLGGQSPVTSAPLAQSTVDFLRKQRRHPSLGDNDPGLVCPAMTDKDPAIGSEPVVLKVQSSANVFWKEELTWNGASS
jgi:hypothetical protein